MTPGTVSSHRSSPSAMTGFWTLPSERDSAIHHRLVLTFVASGVSWRQDPSSGIAP